MLTNFLPFLWQHFFKYQLHTIFVSFDTNPFPIKVYFTVSLSTPPHLPRHTSEQQNS